MKANRWMGNVLVLLGVTSCLETSPTDDGAKLGSVAQAVTVGDSTWETRGAMPPGRDGKKFRGGYIAPHRVGNESVEDIEAKRRLAIAELRAMRAANGHVHWGEEGPPSAVPAPPSSPMLLGTGGVCPEGEICTEDPPGYGGAANQGGSTSSQAGGAGMAGGGGVAGGATVPGCGWASLGPTNIPGRVLDIGLDPTNPNIMYLGTVGGVYQSKGIPSGKDFRVWKRISDNLGEFPGDTFSGKVGAVLVSGSEILVGLGDRNHRLPAPKSGIYQYTEGTPGTWAKVSPPALDTGIIHRLVFETPAAQKAYAATDDGVYVGTKSSGAWVFEPLTDTPPPGGGAASNPLAGLPVSDIEVDTSVSPPIIYAAQEAKWVDNVLVAYGGIWKYVNGVWSTRHTGLPVAANGDANIFHVELALAEKGLSSPGPRQVLYARVTTETGRANKLYRSDSAGESLNGAPAWLEKAVPTYVAGGNPDLDAYNFLLEADPLTPDRVYYGAVNFYVSDDGGSTWPGLPSETKEELTHNVGTNGAYPVRLHDDVHALVFDPNYQTNGVYHVGTDGGLYTKVNVQNGTWHWNWDSHGIRNTEYYTVTGQNSTSTLVGGGMQDNGVQMTFGNRSWYPLAGADGTFAAADAENPLIFYGSDQEGYLNRALNPVAYVAPFFFSGEVPANRVGSGYEDWFLDGALMTSVCAAPPGTCPDYVAGPLVADPTEAYQALAVSRSRTVPSGLIDDWGIQKLVKTTDGVHWNTVLPLEPNWVVTPEGWTHGATKRLAISQGLNADTGKKSCYAWVSERRDQGEGDFNALNGGQMMASHDGCEAGTWSAGQGIPKLGTVSVNAIAIDPGNPKRAMAVTSGAELYLTTDGVNWSAVPVAASSPLATPTTAPMLSLVINPLDTNQFFVAHSIGVLRGTLVAGTSGPEASWQEFNSGLPDMAVVNDLWVNPSTNILTAGTFGYGIYRVDLDDATCQAERLLIRDNVFDVGEDSSPFGVPDPEHPVVDPTQPVGNGGKLGYKPNDDPGGMVYFWDSTDIRVDVPSLAASKNVISYADNPAFESCPIEVADCFPGTMVDRGLHPGRASNVYVQASQLGVGAVSGVRVAALVAEATVEVPPLPSDFWTTTFAPRAAGDTPACGAFNTNTGWTLLGCGGFDDDLGQGVPQVKKFPWAPSASLADHTCMIALVDSANDPISDSTRSKFRVEEFISTTRQAGQRNLYVIEPPQTAAASVISPSYTGVTWLWVPNYTSSTVTKDVLISTSGMEVGSVSYLLPVGVAPTVPGLPAAWVVSDRVSGETSLARGPHPSHRP